MQLDKEELVVLAKQADGRVFRLRHAALVGGVLGSAALMGLAIVFAGNACRQLEDVVFYILIPSLFGGLIGTSLGLAVFSAITRHRVHPVLAAITGGVLTPAISATLMIVCLRVFKPDLFSSGNSLGNAFELSWWWMVYLFIVFPVSIICGVIGGCLFNGRLAKP
ncbi:hypothetical protein NHH03_20285 [Stieleria sp. TO1_6]|uniref:hypothetical protein n=1 Tax=Stieleria tagensis TaxID=2956795 RepID=UPI00209B21E2|nr:hypothetical protein [Stieleria tagensis]MCO8124094.1 hypothetical protein [Stieleria tagensis]